MFRLHTNISARTRPPQVWPAVPGQSRARRYSTHALRPGKIRWAARVLGDAELRASLALPARPRCRRDHVECARTDGRDLPLLAQHHIRPRPSTSQASSHRRRPFVTGNPRLRLLPARRARPHCRASASGASPATGAASAARSRHGSWARRCRDGDSPTTTAGGHRQRTE